MQTAQVVVNDVQALASNVSDSVEIDAITRLDLVDLAAQVEQSLDDFGVEFAAPLLGRLVAFLRHILNLVLVLFCLINYH